MELGKLAVLMGEPFEADGVRQAMMAEELSDLPLESLDYAIAMWRRGDKRHLSEFQQGNTRVGVFFPKAAELREIAAPHAAEAHRQARDREQARQLADDERHRREHPERYFNLGELMESVLKRKGMATAPPEPPQRPAADAVACPHCGGSVEPLYRLSGFSAADLRAMADGIEKRAEVAQA